MDKRIISPCISICKTDPLTGFCYGCARTNEEKNLWKEKILDETWKKENLNLIKSRMSGWQLNTFIESYNYKVHSGISLFKKNLLKK